VLYRHPAVLEASVVARPHPHWGETPCAFVTLREGHRWEEGEGGGGGGGGGGTSEAEIVEFCRARLAHFKAPVGSESIGYGGRGGCADARLRPPPGAALRGSAAGWDAAAVSTGMCGGVLTAW